MKDYFKLIGGAVVAIVIFTALGWALKPIDKMVDRQVQVSSHQYQESMNSREATLRATMAELDGMIAMNPDNKGLQAKKRAIRIQLNSIANK